MQGNMIRDTEGNGDRSKRTQRGAEPSGKPLGTEARSAAHPPPGELVSPEAKVGWLQKKRPPPLSAKEKRMKSASAPPHPPFIFRAVAGSAPTLRSSGTSPLGTEARGRGADHPFDEPAGDEAGDEASKKLLEP